MPVEIVNGYPCKFCGGKDIYEKEDITYYWIDTNIILREKITDYLSAKTVRWSLYALLNIGKNAILKREN